MPAAVGAVLVTVPDGVGDAGFTGLAGERVVPPLSGGEADGVDGWEVDDVEPHRTGVIDAGEAFAERGSAMSFAGCGPREELVPRREESFGAVNHDERVTC